MKIVCSQSDLKSQLAFVSRVVPSRPEPIVLGNVLLLADEATQRVTLTGFDGSLGIRTSFPAEVSANGTITLPAKFFNDIVSRLPEMEITLSWGESDEETGGLVAILSSASGKFQLNGMDAAEFPELPIVDNEDIIDLPIATMLEGLKGCLFAASTEISKQILTGVHLAASEDNKEFLEFAATDSHRLSVLQASLTNDQDTEDDAGANAIAEDQLMINLADFSVTIPARALRELEKMLTDGSHTSKTVKICYDETQILFELGDRILTTMRLTGTYPPYQRLIPANFTRNLVCDRKSLLSSLELVAVLAQKTNIVKFTLNAANSELILSVDAQDIGSATQSLPAEITGEDVDIAFNIKYLMDGLKALSANDIKMQLNEWNQPVIFTPVNGYLMTYLVMPVQIRS
ncbi:DNA polymerase III, beta subunit [Xenococcus sp. PCC 7305]|uniref:DNA polymerase III subunit beta n=1 Tax=Xenococcus sp. PCC 7305 TaxID=102125 RepID=UPI0002AC044B|nr:DNA polymerase III subunit beta [Xenococcus sp. PCC 7305]ELS02051.1 DNA polymerase III, beta subunit [Xenococcus sp. PCC 7305]